MSGQEVSGLQFLAFVVAWTVFCCVVGYCIDRVMVKLGFWRAP